MQEQVTELVVQLLTVAIQLVIVLAGGALVRWLRARYTTEQIARARDVALLAVQAVEQIAAAGGWPWHSATKMAQARKRFRQLAGNLGLQLTDEHIDALIEAAVLRLRATGEELKRPPAA